VRILIVKQLFDPEPTAKALELAIELLSRGDLSPKNRTMTTMRFPDNVTQWRFQHEEEALQRRTDH
jgi:hypothetical protein